MTFPPRNAVIRYSLVIAFLFALALVVALYTHLRHGVLFLLGGALGLALITGHIGFTSAWRKAILKQDARPLGNQFVLLFLASCASLAVLAAVPDAVPNKAPVSLSLCIGAFLFGVGMQLGRGCGSGTAVNAGSGSEHSLLTLVFFMIGSLLGSWHLPVWLRFASIDPVYFPDMLAWPVIVLAYAMVFMLLLLFLGKRMSVPLKVLLWQKRRLVGGIVLVTAAMLVLVFSGSMWGMTFAYTLWAAKLASAAGLEVASWTFWQWDLPAAALQNAVLTDVTSLTTLGLMAGAFLYALCHGALAGRVGMNAWQIGAAVLGGLLMGYGARLSFGCNIGALFSGLASGSLHGWIWFACAFVGSWMALRTMPSLCNLKRVDMPQYSTGSSASRAMALGKDNEDQRLFDSRTERIPSIETSL